MRVSHETIYKHYYSLYVQGRGELRRELARCLRTGRALRKPRKRASAKETRGRIPGMVNIAERPPEGMTAPCPATGNLNAVVKPRVVLSASGSRYGVWSRSMAQMTLIRRRARAMSACLWDLPCARFRS
jgi:hypothetical protein